MEALVVDAGVMGKFVHDGEADLVGEIVRIGEVLLERQAEEADLVREGHPVGAVLDGRRALVQPIERLRRNHPRGAQLLGSRLILDHDRDGLEQLADLAWQVVEGTLHKALESIVAGFGRQGDGDAAMRPASSLGAAATEGHAPILLRMTPLQPWPGEPVSLVVTLDTGDRVHYFDWGGPDPAITRDGRPPGLLLLHGLGLAAWSWTPIARRLRTITSVVAMDLRGHGLSDSPRTGYELAEHAFDALTVMSANGWGSDVGGPPAVVAGHGFGAMIAATMGVLRPGSVAALALVDAGWENVAETTGQSPDEFERGLGDPPEVLASLETLLADRRDYDPASWDADQERAARDTVDQKYAGHVKSVARPHVIRGCVSAIFDYRPEDTLARATMPVLVAAAGAGTADDEEGRLRSLALDDLQRARSRAGLAAIQVVNFAGAGHNLMRYRPAELSTALASFLGDARYQRS